MSKKLAEEFAAKYRPIAEQVGKEIGVDPNVILSQWALESAYGKKIPASHNIAGIKDFSGKGRAAKDAQTGSVDKYIEFEDPEVFGMYYADMIRRQFPYAVNTGEDIGAFTRGLVAGRSGAYFGGDPQRYATGLTSFYNTMPGTERMEPPDVSQFVADGAAPAGAPEGAPPAGETDEERDARIARESQEYQELKDRRIAQVIGGGVGVGVTAARGVKGMVGAAAEEAGRRSETGRQAVQAAAQAAAQRSAAVTPPTTPPAGAPDSVVRQAGIEPTSAQTTRILQGTTGDAGTTGRARMSGFAAETSQTAAAQKQAYDVANRLRQMGIVTEDAPTFFARQQGLTSSPSGVLIPRSEPPKTLGPRGPLGQIGGNRPPAVRLDIPTGFTEEEFRAYLRQPDVEVRPRGPSLGQRTVGAIKSGLDVVSDTFKSMMKPVGTVARYVAPPLALAGAAGESLNIAQQMGKPQAERDVTGMGLSGLNLLGTGMSFFPATMPIGIPLSLGTAAAQEYRKNPEFKKYVDENLLSGGRTEGGLPIAP